MENFGLIDALRTKCDEKGYYFMYGDDGYNNYLADNQNDKILRADFGAKVTRENGVIQSTTYTGLIGLGQKNEETTQSNLDEFPLQKYDRRLKALTTELSAFIGELACVYELEVTAEDYSYELNEYDLNADFVTCSITFLNE